MKDLRAVSSTPEACGLVDGAHRRMNIAEDPYHARPLKTEALARAWGIQTDVEQLAAEIREGVVEDRIVGGWYALAVSEEQDREMQMLTAATPLGRLGDSDEIADAALFLASDESSFVNGSDHFVDGGLAQI